MIKVGDTVTRMVAGGVPMMECTVSEIDDKFIHCGAWKFDKKTGAEVDEYLGWGVVDADGTVRTGTYLDLSPERPIPERTPWMEEMGPRRCEDPECMKPAAWQTYNKRKKQDEIYCKDHCPPPGTPRMLKHKKIQKRWCWMEELDAGS